jgi:hypothetical protein
MLRSEVLEGNNDDFGIDLDTGSPGRLGPHPSTRIVLNPRPGSGVSASCPVIASAAEKIAGKIEKVAG